MTIKEIAELCGVNETTVLRWIRREDFLNCKMQLRNSNEDFLNLNFGLRNRIREKLENGSPENPSDYDLEETLAIIGDGGKNKTLAALLAENAQNKDAITVSNGVPAQIGQLTARLDGLENAINNFTETLKQALIRPAPSRKAIEHKHYGEAPLKRDRKELAFKDFISKNIEIMGSHFYMKKADVWQWYKEYVKKEDRLGENEFFEELAVAFPGMSIDTGKNNQIRCYGVKIKGNFASLRACGELE